MRPAGRTLHENESLPIKDNSSHFVHFLRECSKDNSYNKDCFLLEVILASIEIVLRCMSKNVSEVAGPSTLDGLMGALIVLHSASMA